MQHCLTSLKVVKVGLHVKVNRRESYREHLATMFGCESNSWRAGSLRLRCDQRAGENSQSTKFSLPVRVNFCRFWEKEDGGGRSAVREQERLNWESSVSFSNRLDMARFREAKLGAAVYVALASFCVPYRALRQALWRKPTNALAIIYVVFWPHLHVSVTFCNHPQGVKY